MDYISSFCGIAPFDDPKYILLIYYDTPKGTNYYGATVAGPTFAKVMQDALPYLGLECKYTEEEMKKLEISAPFVVGSKVDQAKNKIASLGFSPTVSGNGDTVVSQIPEAGAKMPKGGKIILYTDNSNLESKVKVPKLIGLTPASVNKEATAAGINVVIKGVSAGGSVSVSQSIAPGTEVKKGTVVTVEFKEKKEDQIAD